jgi:hypothetical protein
MKHRTDRRTCSAADAANHQLIVAWLQANADLLGAIAVLRRLGSEAEHAIAAVYAIPTVRRAQLSWQLGRSLAEGSGSDWERLLLRFVSLDVIDLSCVVLDAPEAPMESRLRLAAVRDDG